MKVIETKLPAGEIIGFDKLEDGTWVVKQKVAEARKTKALDDIFILIDAENLSLDDAFMHHEPNNWREEDFKALLTEAITKGVKNFYRPKYDPAFTDDGEGIRFVARKKPAVGKSYNWWEEVAKVFNPERNSRLGTRLEYVAFLGVLIKALVAEGKSVEWAWNAVCKDSRELGHYLNSKNAKDDFQSTGSRSICGFYDLANTGKYLAGDEEAGGFWVVEGCCRVPANVETLTSISDFTTTFRSWVFNSYVGWLVLS